MGRSSGQKYSDFQGSSTPGPGVQRTPRITKAAESFDAVLKMAGDSQEAMEELLGKTLNRIVTLTGDPVIQIGTTLTRGTPLARTLGPCMPVFSRWAKLFHSSGTCCFSKQELSQYF